MYHNISFINKIYRWQPVSQMLLHIFLSNSQTTLLFNIWNMCHSNKLSIYISFCITSFHALTKFLADNQYNSCLIFFCSNSKTTLLFNIWNMCQSNKLLISTSFCITSFHSLTKFLADNQYHSCLIFSFKFKDKLSYLTFGICFASLHFIH